MKAKRRLYRVTDGLLPYPYIGSHNIKEKQAILRPRASYRIHSDMQVVSTCAANRLIDCPLQCEKEEVTFSCKKINLHCKVNLLALIG
jgi:hypothetical protein